MAGGQTQAEQIADHGARIEGLESAVRRIEASLEAAAERRHRTLLAAAGWVLAICTLIVATISLVTR
jgi:hypothetical protein